ncbi:response regulator [Altericista sp. CCNU0014]|uniref:response regulator n=1 Tax=Altericista sp. CCNU0014 TaxID=3082949 RepID=UPI00384E29CC
MIQLSEPNLEIDSQNAFEAARAIQEHLQGIQRGYLEIDSGSTKWFVYIDCGQLLYITHSVESIDRLDCHLRGLSRRIPAITQGSRAQIRLSLDSHGEADTHPRPDYQGIGMLLQDETLDPEAARALILSMSKEALESLLLVREGTTTFVPSERVLSIAEPLDFDRLLQECDERIQVWQSLAPHICSPYQRPYLFSQSQSLKLTSERQQRLGKLLKGFSFRHLAIMLDQDELKLVKSLYPLILDKAILLREAQFPYSELPSFATTCTYTQGTNTQDTSTQAVEAISAEATPAPVSEPSESVGSFDALPQSSEETKTFRVACIDDSPAMLQTIEQFLGDENLSLSLIQDSLKALVELMRIKPDLILLDVGMPKVDGYELCRLLRKHSMFKKIPIIMVTGNTGLIDRARAKMAGTTDYMTKPFTQEQLLKMVFRYLV